MGADFAHTEAAEDARVRKAREVARWLWSVGVRPGELGSWDELTLRRAGREAARVTGVNAPGSPETWSRVEQMLEMKLEWAVRSAPGEVPPDAAGRPEWLPAPRGTVTECEREVNEAPIPDTGVADTTETAPAAQISSPSASTEAAPAAPTTLAGRIDAREDDLALADAIARHPATRSKALLDLPATPRGWVELVASGRTLGHGRTCGITGCSGAAVAACMTLYRCAEHPPLRGEWGHALDWTPKTRTCAPNRCYCGACPSHSPLPVSRQLAVVTDDEPGDAHAGAAKARAAARAGRSSR